MNTEESIDRRTEILIKVQIIRHTLVYSGNEEVYKASFCKILNQYRERAETASPEGCNAMEEYNNARFIYEFKLNETAEKALEAIEKYQDKYFTGDDVICVGINYDIDSEDLSLDRTITTTWTINWYSRDGKLKKHFPKKEFIYRGAVDTHVRQESIHDHYELLEKVSFGCTSTLYKCREKKTGKIYAAKVVHITQNYGFHGKEETLREMKIMRQLDHPNIVHFYEGFEYEDKMALIIEYLSGEIAVEKRRNISEKLLKHYVKQVTGAIRHMHERNIFHHDIERNVMCVNESSDDVKVFDFGMAIQSDTTDVKNGIFPHIRGPASDIYSLGSMMYWLVSGLNAEQQIQYSEDKALNWTKSCFKNLSEECLSFMKKLLVEDRTKAMTIRQVMSQPWLMRKD